MKKKKGKKSTGATESPVNNKRRRRRRKSFSFFFPFKNSLEIDFNPFSFLFTKNTRDHRIIRESEKLGEALSCFVFSSFVLFFCFVTRTERKRKNRTTGCRHDGHFSNAFDLFHVVNYFRISKFNCCARRKEKHLLKRHEGKSARKRSVLYPN